MFCRKVSNTMKLSASVLAMAIGVPSINGAVAQDDDFTFEEIVVTANKREQSINDVGMSVNALGSRELKQKGIRNVEDLTAAVPGLTFTRTQFDEPVYTIRGIGYVESSLAASPAVSVYVDEIPLPFPSMTRGAILDVERVEVLKGPQGTLFGQNATGGAINYVAAKPGDETEIGLDATYSRFGSYELNGFVSGPISEKVGARLSLGTVQGGSWQKSDTRNDELGDKNEFIGRLIVEIEPSDTFRLLLNINGWQDKSETQAAQHKAIFGAVPGVPLDPLLLVQPIVGEEARTADWNDNTDFVRDTSFYQGSLRAEWDMTDSMTVTSITSYQKLERDALGDADATPGEALHLRTGGDIESFVQELRLSGASDTLNWMVGLNYQKDDINDIQTVFLDTGTSSTINFGPPLGSFHYPFFDNITSNDIETWGVFGAVEVSLTDTFSIEASARYTESENRFEGCTADPGDGNLANLFSVLQLIGTFSGATPTTAATAGECITLVDANFNVGSDTDVLDENNFSWRLNMNWTPSDDVLVYANASKGFKAGNFPNLSASDSKQFVPVTQESLLAYEVGTKVSFPDQNMQLNGSAFYYDYTNKQLRGRVQDPLFGQLEALVNIPESHVWGVEVQWAWHPTANFSANAGATYLETEIDGSFVNFTQFGDTADFGGNAFPFSPKFQANANFDYSDASGWSDIDWFVGTSAFYTSSTKGGLSNRPELDIDSYFLLDLRAGVRADDESWSLMAWGKNITNEYYIVNVLKAQDNVIAYAGRPATYGLTLSLRF